MTMGDHYLPEGHQRAFLAELAMDLCDVDEARLIAEHLRACETCADAETGAEAERRAAEAVDALLLALVGADSDVDADADMAVAVNAPLDAPSPAQVLTAARARRSPAPRVPAFATPFAAGTSMLDAVLAEVGDEVLRRPSPVLDWRLGDLVPHVAAGNALLATAIGIAVVPSPERGASQVDHTERLLAWVAGWPRARVQALWRGDAETIAARLRAEPALAARIVEVDGVPAPVTAQLTIRGFEAWIHARDIGAAAGLSVPAPPVDSLGAMADLAARLLSTLPRRTPTAPAGVLRLTLTGPGGGSWLVQVGGHDAVPVTAAAEPEAEVTADVVEFCLLVADRGRLTPAQVEIAGGLDLATELLTIAPLLARP